MFLRAVRGARRGLAQCELQGEARRADWRELDKHVDGFRGGRAREVELAADSLDMVCKREQIQEEKKRKLGGRSETA
jgi:hypothetical protein